MDYERGSLKGTLTPALLTQWLAEGDTAGASEIREKQAGWIISLLQRANHGALPRPRHHGYGNESFGTTIPPGLRIMLQHFDLGAGIWWLDWVVIVGTIPGVWWIVRRRRSSMPLTPTKDAA